MPTVRVKPKTSRPRYSGAKSAFIVIMRYKGVSNADIARYMGVNQRTVIKWQANPHTLTLRQLTQLCGLLCCSVEFLVYCLTINNAHASNQVKASAAIEEDKIRFDII
jgi:DNA-binding Xre family transcriptional regulator